jgi:hypothetical protein
MKERHYSLRGHRKTKEAASAHPDRNRQFLYLRVQKAAFLAAGWPIVSVDAKKKELIGAFKNAGRAWRRQPVEVNVHDFPTEALGKAVPYGVYDLAENRGAVWVGDSGDTPRFAVDALVRWWETEGAFQYPTAPHLLILADGGGSNGYRSRGWKHYLQERLCDPFGLTVTVCHYPTGCSKYNPIEHRLFGPISKNWAGQVLSSFEGMLAYVRGTTNTTGLQVTATRLEGVYPTKEKITDTQMAALRLDRHFVCPLWNYTLRPDPHRPLAFSQSSIDTELICLQ